MNLSRGVLRLWLAISGIWMILVMGITSYGSAAPLSYLKFYRPLSVTDSGNVLYLDEPEWKPALTMAYPPRRELFVLDGVGWRKLNSNTDIARMAVIQQISARIGRTTGKGIAANIRQHYSNAALQGILFLLVVANTINIGADLGAMADALRLLIGGPTFLYVLFLGALCAALQVFIPYSRYVSYLKWLTFSLFAYFGTVLVVKVPWGEAARGFLIPTLSSKAEFWTVVVAIFGTTISPYLFFWQASQEVEEIKNVAARKPLVKSPEQGANAIERIKVDTYIGMAFSNLVALAIMFTTAATLHAAGTTDIQTTSQAAEALKPIAGPFAFAIFTMGVVGTGLLAVPVLAGSAAYGIGEAFKWPTGLDRKPKKARAFYTTIVIATLSGIAITFSPLDPIKALFWSAVINGLVAVPVMAMMMFISSNKRIMGKFVVTGILRAVGWLTTGVMAAACIVMIATSAV
jgi:Mn2+/Fe2+ NRAMP family transporter